MNKKNYNPLLLLVASFLIAMPVFGQHSGTTANPLKQQTGTLAKLIDQRLSYMKDVAAYKWVHSLAIEDLEREAIVLENSLTLAAQYQLDTASMRQFFELQISLAKRVQEFWFKEWKKKGFQNYEFRDLQKEIRPALLALDKEVLQFIHQAAFGQKSAGDIAHMRHLFFQQFPTKSISMRDKIALFDALTQPRDLDQELTVLSR